MKTEAYLENVRENIRYDEIVKIQKKAAKIDQIKLMKQKQKEKTNQVSLAQFFLPFKNIFPKFLL